MKTLPFSNIKDVIARNMKNTNSLDEVLSSIVLESYQEGFQEGLDSAIEEFEKIKAEFEDKILLNQTVAIQIMEKHISELKGGINNE